MLESSVQKESKVQAVSTTMKFIPTVLARRTVQLEIAQETVS